eukprot:2395209-Prymnesium_polylepis.3
MENALSRDDYEHDYCDLFKLATEAYNIRASALPARPSCIPLRLNPAPLFHALVPLECDCATRILSNPMAQPAYRLGWFVTESLLSVNMLMLLATMFKFFHLSPKLGVLTSTVSRASIELLWFMLLFFNVFIGVLLRASNASDTGRSRKNFAGFGDGNRQLRPHVERELCACVPQRIPSRFTWRLVQPSTSLRPWRRQCKH